MIYWLNGNILDGTTHDSSIQNPIKPSALTVGTSPNVLQQCQCKLSIMLLKKLRIKYTLHIDYSSNTVVTCNITRQI